MKYRVVKIPKEKYHPEKGHYVWLQYRPWWWPFWSTRGDGAYGILPTNFKTVEAAVEEMKCMCNNATGTIVAVEAEFK